MLANANCSPPGAPPSRVALLRCQRRKQLFDVVAGGEDLTLKAGGKDGATHLARGMAGRARGFGNAVWLSAKCRAYPIRVLHAMTVFGS